MGVIDNGKNYKVNKNGNQFYYSKKMYGEKYAKLMAEYSFKNNIKIYNWFEEKDDYIVIFSLFKKENKIYEILINKEDYNLIKNIYWQIYKDNNEYYAVGSLEGNKKIKMHRLIMGIEDKKILVDHIKGNGLDNRRSNLRLTNTRDNSTNYIHIPKNNNSGILGVYKRNDNSAWVCNWNDKNTQKRKSKSFAIKKYGEEEAKNMAINYRNKMTLKNEYLSALDSKDEGDEIE